MTEQRRGDELIDRLCAGADDDAANDLLREAFRGYPLDNLRRLAACDEPAAVKAVAWILSELGPRAMPLLDVAADLLGHPLRYARFFAIDVMLAAHGPDHGATLAKAVQLVVDDDEAVRWKTLRLLTNLTTDQLRATLPYHERADLTTLTRWLIDLETDGDRPGRTTRVEEALQSPDWPRRAFAVAAAARIAPADDAALRSATASPDREVASFANEQLTS